jgi:predicted RNA polymerase sigma factor
MGNGPDEAVLGRLALLCPGTRLDEERGRSVEARTEFERAAKLTSNEAERAHLLARAGSA